MDVDTHTACRFRFSLPILIISAPYFLTLHFFLLTHLTGGGVSVGLCISLYEFRYGYVGVFKAFPAPFVFEVYRVPRAKMDTPKTKRAESPVFGFSRSGDITGWTYFSAHSAGIAAIVYGEVFIPTGHCFFVFP